MSRCAVLSLSLAALSISQLIPGALADDEIQTKSPISSVALFKNGLAVVTRTLSADKAGLYVVEEPMRPIHGTFWIAPGSDTTVRGETRKMDKPNTEQSDLNASLLGLNATFTVVAGNSVSTITGKVVEATPGDGRKTWSQQYSRYVYMDEPESRPDQCTPKFIAVKTGSDSVTLLRTDSIVKVAVSSNLNQTVKEDRPVFIFNVKKKPSGPISYSYLSKGLSWAPSYRMLINDSSNITLTLAGSIRNELEDLKDADCNLICGYPNIAMANVSSLLNANSSWAQFFQQAELALMPGALSRNSLVAIQSNAASAQAAAAPLTGGLPGETADITYVPIGKLSLKEGGSLWFELVSEKTDYEKIVECIIPDRYLQQSHQAPQETETWDSIRFKNPFKFPMTTAPVDISDATGFQGQCIGSWAAPGSEVTLHITKALSVAAKCEEQELNNQRIVVYEGNQSYFKTVLQGVLTVKNFRSEPVKMSVKLQFSGNLVNAEGSPKCKLRDGGIYSVNKRNELCWEVSAKPNEEFNLKYSYSVLINR